MRLAGPARALTLILPAVLYCLAAPPAPAEGAGVLVVDRERMVSQSEAARSLRRIEIELRERAQAQLDEVREALEAEEKELTRLREEMPKEEFDELARDFDRRVRIERRKAQERGAQLQEFISEAQEALRSAADPVLREMRREKGVAVLIDAGAVAAVDPELDVTDEAIARFDAAVSEVTFTPPRELEAE